MSKGIKIIVATLCVIVVVLIGTLTNWGRPKVRPVEIKQIAKVEQETIEDPVILGGTDIYSQSFDALNDGNLIAQDSYAAANWEGDTDANDGQVSATYALAGTKGVRVYTGGANTASGVQRVVTTDTAGETIYTIKFSWNNYGLTDTGWFILSNGAPAANKSNWIAYIKTTRSSAPARDIYIGGSAETGLSENYGAGTHTVNIKVNWNTLKVNGQVDGGGYSAVDNFYSAQSQITHISFGLNETAVGGANAALYFDDVSIDNTPNAVPVQAIGQNLMMFE